MHTTWQPMYKATPEDLAALTGRVMLARAVSVDGRDVYFAKIRFNGKSWDRVIDDGKCGIVTHYIDLPDDFQPKPEDGQVPSCLTYVFGSEECVSA